MKKMIITLYSFSELSEQAQQKALENLAYINVEHNWWDDIYQDAKIVGIEIQSFDVEWKPYANGKIMNDTMQTAIAICDNHGKETGTYKKAEEFLRIINNYKPDDDVDTREEIEEDFKRKILHEYAKILKNQYDCRQSKEAIIETIEANDYTFEEDGTLNNESGGEEMPMVMNITNIANGVEHEFDSFEIHPCKEYTDSKGEKFIEQVMDLKEETPDFWSVYLHNKNPKEHGVLYCIADCQTEEQAKNLVSLLEGIVDRSNSVKNNKLAEDILKLDDEEYLSIEDYANKVRSMALKTF